jgi:hypothetical protein
VYQNPQQISVTMIPEELCVPLSSGAILGIGLGSLAGLIVIIAIIAITVYCCKKKQRRRGHSIL